MASKRSLKKQFISLANFFFEQGLLLRTFASQEQVAQVDEILDEIIVWTDDTIRRIGNPDAKDNPKLVHAYYQALRQAISEHAAQIDERLTQFLEQL